MYGARVPDHRGLFKRGYGEQAHLQENGTTVGVTSTLHQSGALGQVQGDATRNITGNFQSLGGWMTGALRTDSIYLHLGPPREAGEGFYNKYFDASRVTPTAGEIRPANTAVRYLMRALK